MQDVVIASACRTAIGAFGGALKDSHAATIAGETMKVGSATGSTQSKRARWPALLRF